MKLCYRPVKGVLYVHDIFNNYFFTFSNQGHQNTNVGNVPYFFKINEHNRQPHQEFSITVKILDKMRVELLVQGFHDRRDVFTFFASGILKNLSEKILLIKIQYDDDNVKLSVDEQKKLGEIFSERDVVIVQSIKDSHETAIYWTSNKIGHLLAVSSFSESLSNQTRKLYEFIEYFLVESLDKGHSGKRKISIS